MTSFFGKRHPGMRMRCTEKKIPKYSSVVHFIEPAFIRLFIEGLVKRYYFTDIKSLGRDYCVFLEFFQDSVITQYFQCIFGHIFDIAHIAQKARYALFVYLGNTSRITG